MLKVCNSIYAQVTHAEIAFIYKIFRFQIKIQEIIIPEKLGQKMHFRTTQSKKHFPENVFQTGWSEKHFPENIFQTGWSEKAFSALVFPEI